MHERERHRIILSAVQEKSVARVRPISSFRESELGKGRVEQVAGVIAGEGPARAIGAVLTGRESDDGQPCGRIAECRNRRVPPAAEVVRTSTADSRASWGVRPPPVRFRAVRARNV